MRKLPPFKAISHAFGSVRNYAAVGIRFSLLWTAILLALAIIGSLTAPPPPLPSDGFTPPEVSAVELLSAIVGLVAFCSIAVNWHRFILRDEAGGRPMRLDGEVWRYLGNSLLVVLLAILPLVVMAVVLAFLPPMANILLIPGAVAAVTFALALSIKLPAVALGRRDFGFKDAIRATQDNFWPLMAVGMLNGAIVLLMSVIVVIVVSAFMSVSAILGTLAGLVLVVVLKIFYTLFSISIVSSLYGFFVEKRDF
jgi:hypothetical protein